MESAPTDYIVPNGMCCIVSHVFVALPLLQEGISKKAVSPQSKQTLLDKGLGLLKNPEFLFFLLSLHFGVEPFDFSLLLQEVEIHRQSF